MDRTTHRPKRILYIDEQPICQLGLERTLNGSTEFTILGFLNEVDEVNRHHKPDIIAIELSVAKSKGVASIKELKTRFPEASILVLTGHDETLFAERCLKAGARGYIMKTATLEQLLSALRDLASGNIHISDRMRAMMLDRLSGRGSGRDFLEFERLSDRELLIVQHIGQSKNNKEIANELQISVKTIESHRSRIKAKLQLSSPNELVRYAMRLHEATH